MKLAEISSNIFDKILEIPCDLNMESIHSVLLKRGILKN